MQKTTSYMPIFASALIVSLFGVLYYFERRKNIQESKNNNGEGDGFINENEELGTDHQDNEHKSFQEKQENDSILKTSASVTSYSSMEEEDSEMKSCIATDSSTSAYSTASDDTCVFPVGEYSTYKQQNVDKNLTELDLNEILNSPVVEGHCIDERMKRSPNLQCEQFTQLNDSIDATNIVDKVESTNVNSIIVAYSDIVPPLCPNTGDMIRPSVVNNA